MALENVGQSKQSREECLEESNNRGKCYRKLQYQGITEIWSEENNDCEKQMIATGDTDTTSATDNMLMASINIFIKYILHNISSEHRRPWKAPGIGEQNTKHYYDQISLLFAEL